MRLRHPLLAILALLVVLLSMVNFFTFDGESGQRGQLRGISIFVTHPMGMLAGAYLLFVWAFPRAIGRVAPDTAQRVEQARASGSEIASTLCSAQLGRLHFRGPLLRVTVHPGGIVFRPILMAARAILAPELLAVESKRGILNRTLVISHTGPDIGSPVRLHIGEDTPAAQAIRSLLPSQASQDNIS
jgi:hypothetical protein